MVNRLQFLDLMETELGDLVRFGLRGWPRDPVALARSLQVLFPG